MSPRRLDERLAVGTRPPTSGINARRSWPGRRARRGAEIGARLRTGGENPMFRGCARGARRGRFRDCDHEDTLADTCNTTGQPVPETAVSIRDVEHNAIVAAGSVGCEAVPAIGDSIDEQGPAGLRRPHRRVTLNRSDIEQLVDGSRSSARSWAAADDN